ncbi:chemotaxis protein [Shewanella sp. NIFS-20-20]|uniref:chemotaxis protein n=1 Tax=Shewanella sp. NIFS-20-20 TaxID=2853806 RepID=UPI001C4488AC|nr:chemotaxis protein [Shewanella sp. NIFS-20-20]MBV7316539.1 chemotaxis protein [Shewanella sp. NIFS-20-20]
MNTFKQLLLTWGVVSMLSGCSLLEVKLESGIEPLPQEQLSMRVFTREYSSTFFAGVEQTADTIANQAKGDNAQILQIKSHSLLWKIHAEQTMGNSIFQVSPVAAMIDTWAFTAQMAQFFESGKGQDLFGDATRLAVTTSLQLLDDYQKRMRGLMTDSAFADNQAFISQYVAANPLFDLQFSRTSAFSDWLLYKKIGEFDAVTTFGSVPEVMTDMSDRMAMLAAQTPKILGWKAEFFALHSNINSDEIKQTLASISDTSAKFQQLMAQSPEMMASLAVDLRTELSPLLEKLDASAAKNLAQLSVERQALETMVTRERVALEQMVNRERQAVAQDVDTLVQRTVEQTFAQISALIKSLILYIILFLLVVFFAPLGLGVWLGKRMASKPRLHANKG